MIYNAKGEILWHKGRGIQGKTIKEGSGFSKTYINKTLTDKKIIEQDNIFADFAAEGIPSSAATLLLKSLLIVPLKNGYFLYIDSGTKANFTQADREVIKTLGLMLEETIEKVKQNDREAGGIAGHSAGMERIREDVLKYAIEEEPVLLLGESGTGKTHIAELIHRYSGRPGPLVTVNIPSIPENICESEIFGHKKGAFTGAMKDKLGYVDEAAGGTLFFDEIAEIPMSFQAKLLRFIERKKYRALGDNEEKEADVRIITATNRDMSQAIERGKFREDLYYRLCILEVTIPPLRNRKEDIKALVREKRDHLRGKELSPGFWDAVFSHDWPGNIRELLTLLIRLGINANDPIGEEDVTRFLNPSLETPTCPTSNEKISRIWEEIKGGKTFWDAVKKPYLARDLNREEVKTFIQEGLLRTNGVYKDLTEIFHLKRDEYYRFMSFLNQNHLK